MLEFISLHLGTIIVGLLVLAGVSSIVIKMVRDKKKGKSVGCGCGCESCPSASAGCETK